EVGVGVPGEAVVTDDTVGDEIAGSGRDVDEVEVRSEIHDAHDGEIARGLHGFSIHIQLARDRRLNDAEEPPTRRKPARDANTRDAVGPGTFEHRRDIDLRERLAYLRQQRQRLVGESGDASRPAALRVKDPREQAGLPFETALAGRLDEPLDD